tara:strand:+ start:3387 stop:3593 length:207 start_codon:yes stop_codon:yes gene_type:complete
MHCSPRKAAAGAMIMPGRNKKAPSRTRFKSGGGNFPDLSGDGKVTQKDILMGRGVVEKKYGGTHKKNK